RPLPLDVRNPEETRFGRLIFRGGITLASPDARFGGLSGLRVSADGRTALAVSDRGTLIRLTLAYDAAGTLTGADDLAIAPLSGPGGKALYGPSADAEALEILPDGRIAIGFERFHRVAILADPAGGVLPPAESLAAPARLMPLADNQGLEALVHLPEMGLTGLAEHRLDAEGRHMGAPIGPRTDEAPEGGLLTLSRIGEFDVTDAALGPDGTLFVLERSFAPLSGPGLQLRAIAAGERTAGRNWEGEILLTLDARASIDNMEGLDAIAGPDGTRLLIVSDDNFSPLQRTVLLAFDLAP
ncbi:MAG: esterase-like activity of phytase family protein, partial [Alphaproteobacteria bacterium]|nr:esterase-like activity of phytase family protein [Alphaproteobacteria bacterium]